MCYDVHYYCVILVKTNSSKCLYHPYIPNVKTCYPCACQCTFINWGLGSSGSQWNKLKLCIRNMKSKQICHLPCGKSNLFALSHINTSLQHIFWETFPPLKATIACNPLKDGKDQTHRIPTTVTHMFCVSCNVTRNLSICICSSLKIKVTR